jgi:hemolysin-activating ACP:hemolysin acyltransferase
MDSEKRYDNLRCLQLRDPMQAYGHTVNLLRKTEPFRHYRFGSFAGVVLGQILRKHYVLTLAGKEVVGYFGWALCDKAIAEAWIERNYVPTFEECNGGDTFVIATFYGKTKQVTFFTTRHVRKMYPNIEVYGRRDYGERLRPMKVSNPMPGAAGEVTAAE